MEYNQQDKIVTYKPERQTKSFVLYYSLFGALVFYIGIAEYLNGDHIWGIAVMFAAIKLTIYKMIDFLSTKTIFFDYGELFIRSWGITFKLHKDHSFLRIENTFVYTGIGAKTPTLNIYRNPPSFIGKLFKNKIKLKKINDDVYWTELEAKKISELFGIQFKDSYNPDIDW